MTQAITTTAILSASLTYLWDGTGRTYGKEKFACFCVTEAMMGLSGMQWGEARSSEQVKPLHARIIRYIEGYETVAEYFEKALDKWATDEEKQAFRKKMLGDILAEYEAQATLLRAKIEVLEAVKSARISGDNDSYYVCDNVRFEALTDKTLPREAVCEDIHAYIGGCFSLKVWLSQQNGKHYMNGDEVVQKARMEMIDTLIARYTEQLNII